MLKRIIVLNLTLMVCFFLSSSLVVEAYQAIKVTKGGKITGVVTLKGKAPKVKMLAVTKNTEFCGKSTPDPRFEISGHNEIKNVVVILEGIEKGKKAAPVKGAVLDNANCVFVPHVQAVTKGTTLTIINSDPILHNTHAYLIRSQRMVFNLALPTKDQKIRRRLKKSGMHFIRCDTGHDQMSAFIYVSENPYYAVTDRSGKFEIADVPPGTYTLKAWHEAFGTMEQKVTVAPRQEVMAGFSFIRK